VLNDDLEMHGLVAGHTTLASGARLVLHGMIAGDLRVEDGAEVDLFGVVSGSIFNRGSVRVTGVVRGILASSDAARTEIADSGVICRGQTKLITVD
jgi:hypothetical protein